MDFEINKNKYVTLVGYVQSGKTNEEINYCYTSINNYKIPVIFITRNIKADILQLLERIKVYNNVITNNKLLVESLSSLTPEKAVQLLLNYGIIVCLYNYSQLHKIEYIIKKYQKNFKGKYNLCIDEVDYSIKNKEPTSNTELILKNIKEWSNHVLGATATPCALFFTSKDISKFKKMDSTNNYRGINSLQINIVNPVIIKNKFYFPYSDHKTINKIYNSLLKKNHSILLHTVVKEKIYHYMLADYITKYYPKFTVIVYNGDGILIFNNKVSQLIIEPSTNSNSKYYYNPQKGHYFKNYSISQVLQILKNNNNSTHITIISGNLASRGISFVSTDYKWHLTDQYLHPSRSTHGENLLQSLRILGCYNDSSEITLWCSKTTWEDILQQFKLIENLINNVNNSIEWSIKIQKIKINKLNRAITRTKLIK